tara:strand:- start:182 stop:352 length:171 start_codon:yes stop_codon:yes gene_type:complete
MARRDGDRLWKKGALKERDGYWYVVLDGKNSTEPHKSTQKHVFLGLTKNTGNMFTI